MTLKYTTLQTLTTYLSTELNSLANNDWMIGAEIDNEASGALWPFCFIEVSLAATSSRTNFGVNIYALPSGDGGTTYPYGSDTLAPQPELLVASLTFPQSETTARVATIHGVVVPGTKFKFLIENKLGVAFAASGSTFKYAFHSYADS